MARTWLVAALLVCCAAHAAAQCARSALETTFAGEASVSQCPASGIQDGETCVVQCDPGSVALLEYECRTGTSSDAFLARGRLSCSGVTCPRIRTTAEVLSSCDTGAANRGYGSSCVTSCQSGTVPDPGSQALVSHACQSDGTWSNGEASCSQADCGALAAGTGFAYTCTGQLVGDSCAATCDEGFRGTPVLRTCGADAQWSGSAPSCARRQCAVLPASVQLQRTCGSRGTGAQCAVQCASGYATSDGQVGAATGATTTCGTQDLQWANLPDCQPIGFLSTTQGSSLVERALLGSGTLESAPPFVSLDSTGLLTGNVPPDADPVYLFNVRPRSGGAFKPMQLEVSPALEVRPNTIPPTVAVNEPFLALFDIVGGNGDAKCNVIAFGPLSGLRITDQGRVTGSATAASTSGTDPFTYVVECHDTNGAFAAARADVLVTSQFIVQTNKRRHVTMNQNVTVATFQPTDGLPPYSFVLDRSSGTDPLPAGLMFATSATEARLLGSISELPAKQTLTFRVDIRDSAGSAQREVLDVDVWPPLEFVSPIVGPTQVLDTYEAIALDPFTGAGGRPPINFAADPAFPLPDGLVVNCLNGQISGTPVQTNRSITVYVLATDASGFTKRMGPVTLSIDTDDCLLEDGNVDGGGPCTNRDDCVDDVRHDGMFECRTEASMASNTLVISLSIVLSLLAIAAVALYIWYRRRDQPHTMRQVFEEIREQVIEDLQGEMEGFNAKTVGKRWNPPLLIKRSALEDPVPAEPSKLGEGHFGEVHRKILRLRDGVTEVAVKTLLEKGDHEDHAKGSGADPKGKRDRKKEHEGQKKANEDFKREIAIMHICRDGCSDPQDRRRPKAAQHVVWLHGYLTRPFRAVMEYCDHGDLKNFLQNMRETNPDLLSPTMRVKFARDISYGLSYLHGRGMIHRDLAARNILVAKHYIAKIGDFGLVRELESNDSQYYKAVPGNIAVQWAAPELLAAYSDGYNTKFSKGTDIWALGCTFVEIFKNGEHPYHGDETVPQGRPAHYRPRALGAVSDHAWVNITYHVTHGHHPRRPEHCGPDTYEAIIEPCFARTDSERPCSDSLYDALSYLVERPTSTAADLSPRIESLGELALSRRPSSVVEMFQNFDAEPEGDPAVVIEPLPTLEEQDSTV